MFNKNKPIENFIDYTEIPLDMLRVDKFDYTFYDSVNVETIISLDKKQIVIKLVDIKGKKCEIHFEDVSKFSFEYLGEEKISNTLTFITEINNVSLNSYEILYTFGDVLKIECSVFYYFIEP